MVIRELLTIGLRRFARRNVPTRTFLFQFNLPWNPGLAAFRLSRGTKCSFRVSDFV